MTVRSFAVLMMLTEAFLSADLAYPPHAATCSTAGSGFVAIYGGWGAGIAGGGGLVNKEHLITATNQGFHWKRCSRLAFFDFAKDR